MHLTFKTLDKQNNQDLESRLDVLCLEMAEKLGYFFKRVNDDLIFIQKGA